MRSLTCTPTYRPLTSLIASAGFGVRYSALLLESFLAAYKGKVSDDGSKLLALSGNHDIAQVVPTSIAFDDAGIGTLVEPGTDTATSVLLPAADWEEPITFSFATTDSLGTFISGATKGEDEICVDIESGAVRALCYSGTTLKTLLNTTGTFNDGLPHTVTVNLSGGIATLDVEGDNESGTWDTTGNESVGFLGQRADGINKFAGNIWDLKGPGFDLAGSAGSGTVERSSTPGLPDCAWSGFTNMAAIYAEHYDGVVGSNRANEIGWSEYENLLTYNEDLTVTLAWTTEAGAEVTSELSFTLPDGAGSGIYNRTLNSDSEVAGRTFTFSVKGLVGSGNIALTILEATTWGGTASDDITLSGIGQTVSVTRTIASGATGIRLYFKEATDTAATVSYDSCILIEGTADDLPDEYITSFDAPVTGRQPAGWNGLTTQHPGPIAADWTARRVALQGDGSLYVTTDCLLTTAFSIEIGYIPSANDTSMRLFGGADENSLRTYNSGSWTYSAVSLGGSVGIVQSELILDEVNIIKAILSNNNTDTTYTITHNGENKANGTTTQASLAPSALYFLTNLGSGVQESGVLNYVKIYNASDELIHHWHMEDGVPYETGVTKVEDIVGGNHGTVVNPTSEADIWTYVDGPSRRLFGYTVDKESPNSVTGSTVDSNISEDPDGTFTCDTAGTSNDNRVRVDSLIPDGNDVCIYFTVLATGDYEYYDGISVYVDLGELTPDTYSYDVTSLLGKAYVRLVTAGAKISSFTLHEKFPGYYLQAESGKDFEGIDLEYRQGQWQTALNCKVPFTPPLNKYSCYNHGQNPILFNDQPALSYSQNTAIGDKAMVDYFDDDPILGPEAATTAAVELSGYEYTDFVSDVGSMSGSSDGVVHAIAGFQLNGISATETVVIQFDADVTGDCRIQEREIMIGAPEDIATIVVGQNIIYHDASYSDGIISIILNIGSAGEVAIRNFSIKSYDDTQTGVIADIIPAVDKYAGILGEELWDGRDFEPSVNYESTGVYGASTPEDSSAAFSFTVVGADIQLHFRYGGSLTDYVTYSPGSYCVAVPNDDNSNAGDMVMQCSSIWFGATVTNISVKQITRETT